MQDLEIRENLEKLIHSLFFQGMNQGDFLESLRELIKNSCGFQKVSTRTGIARESLYAMIQSGGNPRSSSLIAIMKSLTGQKIDKIYCFIDQWCEDKNGPLDYNTLGDASGKKLWWQCPENSQHLWKESISKRLRNPRCPFCEGKKVIASSSLQFTHPHLCEEWSSKNKITPDKVLSISAKRVIWICKKCHEWTYSINRRVLGFGNCYQCELENK